MPIPCSPFLGMSLRNGSLLAPISIGNAGNLVLVPAHFPSVILVSSKPSFRLRWGSSKRSAGLLMGGKWNADSLEAATQLLIAHSREKFVESRYNDVPLSDP